MLQVPGVTFVAIQPAHSDPAPRPSVTPAEIPMPITINIGGQTLILEELTPGTDVPTLGEVVSREQAVKAAAGAVPGDHVVLEHDRLSGPPQRYPVPHTRRTSRRTRCSA